MPLILDTKNFLVTGHDQPLHDRHNGGHALVVPKENYNDRTEMPMDLYIKMMQLVMVTGEALVTVMRRKGIEVVRINYEDKGNWSYFPSVNKAPHLHIHLFVRSWDEKHPNSDPRFLPFPNALFLPFRNDSPEYYRSFQPYSEADCLDIKTEIEHLLNTEKYKSVSENL